MEFIDSGLPNDKTVEKAFNYAQAYVESLKDESLRGFTQQVNDIHNKNMQSMTGAKNAGALPEEEFHRQKAMLEQRRDAIMQNAPNVVAEGLKTLFKRNYLAPALKLQQHSENTSPAIIAAALLLKSVRDPIDAQKVASEIGENVAGVIAEILHIDAYPVQRDAALAAAGSDTKRVYLSVLVHNIDQIALQADQVARQGQKLIFQPGYEESLFTTAKLLWGNDKKLDQHLVETFNRVAATVSSAYKMDVDAEGRLELVKTVADTGPVIRPRPTTPTPPKPGSGGDVW